MRRVAIGVLAVLACYIAWAWAVGRLAPGAVGLLHPTGPYWEKQDVRPRCFTAQHGESKVLLTVTSNSDEKLGTPTVQSESATQITIAYTKTVNVMPHDTTSNASQGQIAVTLKTPFAGQKVVVNGRTIGGC